MQPKPKLIVDSVQLGSTIREEPTRPQKHRQSALRQFESIGGAPKYCCQLRIQTLRHAVANSFLRYRRKAKRTSGINDLYRVIENIEPRWLIAQREVAMNK